MRGMVRGGLDAAATTRSSADWVTPQLSVRLSSAISIRLQASWPVALRAVRAWLEPRLLLARYWAAWSPLPTPLPLQALLDALHQGHGLHLYVPP